MKSLLALLRDRRRSQRGSVLSGVLILLAFIGILSGALMTELSGSVISSHVLVDRVADEATVNSAVEIAFNKLQAAPLGSPCPGPSTVSLNGISATASFLACAPVVDSRSLPLAPIVASTTPFTVDGTQVQLPAIPQNGYMVSDVNGNVYEFNFGQSSPRWSIRVGGTVTGPPIAALDQSQNPYDIVDLVPVTNPNDGGVTPDCGSSGFCVALLTEEGGSAPVKACFMASTARVKARPAASVGVANVAYFGDGSGTLFAYTTIGPGSGGQGSGGGNCSEEGSAPTPGNQPVVAGPVVVRGGNNTDDIYLVASDGSSSHLLRYTFSNEQLSLASSLTLPTGNAIGLAVDRTTGQAPVRLAITFAGGQVALVRIASNLGMTLSASGGVASGVSAAPYWCHCPGGADLIGVGGDNGALYVLDSSLNVVSTYPASGAAITTAPAADAAGDWFFGADDSRLHEVQRGSGSTMTQATQWTLAGRVGSSPVLNGCGTMICIYLGALNGSAYLIPLDARDAVVTACVSTAPPTCSGANPRLWAQVEVGSMGNPQTVHVSGWSYYSP